jgi:hypothetical protein
MMDRGWSRLALVSFLAAATVGCAAIQPGASAAPESDAIPSVSIRMGPDGPELPEDVVAALQAYGAEHAGEFAGLYVEDQSRGSFVMLFTDHLDEHASALAEIWPRVTVRGAHFSEALLTEVLEGLDLQAMAGDGIEPLSAGLDTMNNRVTLDLKSDDPTLEARLEQRYGGMVEVTVHPLPGEWSNVAEGDGWRLLASGEAGGAEAYTVRAATDAGEWSEMWAAIGLGAESPPVDLEDEVAVSFGHGIGSSCPELRLDAIEIGDGVVFSRTSDPLAPRNCTADLVGAAVFVVAIQRDALPDDGFTLQLGPERVTGGGFTEVIDVPLP